MDRGMFHYFAKVPFVVGSHVTIILHISIMLLVFLSKIKNLESFNSSTRVATILWSFCLLYASLNFWCCFEKQWLDLYLSIWTQLNNHVISSSPTCSSQFPCFFLSISEDRAYWQSKSNNEANTTNSVKLWKDWTFEKDLFRLQSIKHCLSSRYLKYNIWAIWAKPGCLTVAFSVSSRCFDSEFGALYFQHVWSWERYSYIYHVVNNSVQTLTDY